MSAAQSGTRPLALRLSPARTPLRPTQDSPLSRQAKRKLDFAQITWSTRILAGDGVHRVSDDPKTCAGDVSIGQSEVGTVEDIEHFGSELEGIRFPQLEIANQRLDRGVGSAPLPSALPTCVRRLWAHFPFAFRHVTLLVIGVAGPNPMLSQPSTTAPRAKIVSPIMRSQRS